MDKDIESFLATYRIRYYRPLRILYCPASSCRKILYPKQVTEHLKSTHGHFTKDELEHLSDCISKDSTLMKDAEDIFNSFDEGPELPFLEIVKGFECSECQLLLGSKRTKYRHIQTTKHQKIKEVSLHYLGQRASKERLYYKIVNLSADMDDHQTMEGQTVENVSGSDRQSIQKKIQDIRLNVETAYKRAMADAATVKEEKEQSAWISRTGWARYFQDGLLEDFHGFLMTMDQIQTEYPDFWTVLKECMLEDYRIMESLNADMRLLLKGQETQHHKSVHMVSMPTLWKYTGYLARIVASIAVASYTNRLVDMRVSLVEQSQFGILGHLLHTEQPTDISTLKKCIRAVLSEVTRTPIPNDQFSSPLICGLAYLGIRKDWKPHDSEPVTYFLTEAALFTPRLAAILHLVRFIVVGDQIRMLLTDNNCLDLQELEGKLLLEGRGGIINDAIISARNLFLYNESSTVFRTIFNLLNYGMSVANMNGLPVVSWNEDSSILYFINRPIRVTDFQQIVPSLLKELDDLLVSGLLYGRFDEINERFFESHITGLQAPFLYDNTITTEQRMKVIHMAARSGSLDKLGLDCSAGMRSQCGAIRAYQARASRFLRNLMVLIHISSGQPARGTELCPIHLYPHAGSKRSNLFNDAGSLVILTTYHKSQNLFGKEKLILRYLDASVSRLLTAYILYVRPVLDAQRAVEQLPPLDSRVFARPDIPGHYFDSRDLSQSLALVTGRFTGMRLGLMKYRHVGIAFARKFLSEKQCGFICVNDPDSEEDDVGKTLDLQAGHTTDIADAIYAVDSNALGPRSPTTLFENFKKASQSWADFLFQRGSYRRKLSNATGSKRQITLEINDLEKDTEEVVNSDAQSKRVKVGTTTSSNNVTGKFDSVAIGEITQNSLVLRALFLLTGSFSYKSPGQERTVSLVLRKKQHVLSILPTGGGKSLAFMLPTLLPGSRITVYIAPLVSLVHDMYLRCIQSIHKHGVRVLLFDGTTEQIEMLSTPNPTGLGTILIVIQDTVASLAFRTLMELLSSKTLLDTCVLDEAHMTITESSYRDVLKEAAGHLLGLNWQILLLTATIPPDMVKDMLSTLQLKPQSVEVVRMATIRTNICYGRYFDPRHFVLNTGRVVTILQTLETQLNIQSTDKVIVFVTTRHKAVDLAARMDTVCYHGEMSENERSVSFSTWISEKRYIIATKALGAGVDISNVRLVVHWECPPSIIDFVQQSGRAGRDGNQAYSVILQTATNSRSGIAEPKTYKDTNRQDPSYSLMQEYLNTESCMRRVLSIAMDGALLERSCSSQSGMVSCNNCSRQFNQISSICQDGNLEAMSLQSNPSNQQISSERHQMSLQDYLDIRKRMEEHNGLLQKVYNFIGAGCPYCAISFIQNQQQPNLQHTFFTCSFLPKGILYLVDSLQKEITRFYQENEREVPITCPNCHFHRAICINQGSCDSPPTAVVIYSYGLWTGLLDSEHYKIGIKAKTRLLARDLVRKETRFTMTLTTLLWEVIDMLEIMDLDVII